MSTRAPYQHHARVPSSGSASGDEGIGVIGAVVSSPIPANNSQQQLLTSANSDKVHKNHSLLGGDGSLRKKRFSGGGGGGGPDGGVLFHTGSVESTYNHGSLSASIEPKITFRQWVTVFILCYVNLINYMDRFTLAGILDQIQCQFGIGNSEAGLLQTVFIMSYMVFAPLFGFLGDRYSRKWIMAGGVFLWSLTTLLGSFMSDFGWFIAFRAMVGIGEASYSTIAPTIISDMFVDHVRSKMLALFYIVIPVGCGLGYIVGSETAALGGSWHWGLRVTPIMGAVAVLLLVFVLIDPPRGESEGSHLKPTSYSADIRYLCKNRSFVLTSFGFTCVAFVTGALAWWGPSFIALGLSTQEGAQNVSTESVSTIFGVITMFAGFFGVVIGSYLSTRLKVLNPRADPLICAFGLLASTPLLFLATIVSQYNTVACYTLIFFGQIFLNLNWSIVADMLLYVVIPTRRSTAEAFQILLSHTFGDAGSPYLVGILSDVFRALLNKNSGATFVTDDASQIHGGMNTDVILANAPLPTTPIPISPSCHNSSIIDPEPNAFKALQYSLFMTSFVEVLGGLFFLMTAWYIINDKMKADKTISAALRSAAASALHAGGGDSRRLSYFDYISDKKSGGGESKEGSSDSDKDDDPLLRNLTIPKYFSKLLEQEAKRDREQEQEHRRGGAGGSGRGARTHPNADDEHEDALISNISRL